MSQAEKPVAKTVGDALRNDATDILDIIDAGLQSYEGRSQGDGYSARDDANYRGVRDERSKCWRCQDRDAGATMDGACDPCAAWVRGEGDDPMDTAEYDVRHVNGEREVDWLDAPPMPEWMREALDAYRRALVAEIHDWPTMFELVMRERFVRAAREQSLRARIEFLHTSFRIDARPDHTTQIECLGIQVVEEPPTFRPIHTDLGLEVVEWNLAWEAIERRVVELPEECDVPPSVIVGNLVPHGVERFDWSDYEAGVGQFTNDQVMAFWLNAE